MSLKDLFNNINKTKPDNIGNLLHDIPVPDFIPYSCHYNSHTILTKNGELLQTIKLVGYSFQLAEPDHGSLRQEIRSTIKRHVKTDNIAIWFHTIRRHSDLEPGGEYEENFSSFLHKEWGNKHNWANKYVNEIFITLIHDAQAMKSTPSMIFNSLFKPYDTSDLHDSLNGSYEVLSATVDNIINDLKVFGSRRLHTFKRGKIYYSELLRFFSKIISVREREIPLPTANLSEYLADFHMAFGNNAFEILHEDHTKSFGALMTFKEYNEVDDSVLDKLLHLDQPFVITQTLNFVHHKEARQKYQQQKYIADLADAKNVRKLSGIDEIMADDNNSYVDYGEQQLTIMPTSDSIIGLNKNIDEMFYALFELGLIALREDLLMEDCFWSQLPANFSFISRQTYTSTSRVAGFSSLNTFPTGHKVRNHWGKAVTVFYTEHGAPYFFNFHHQDNGHTIIIGPEGSGKTVLLNFLLSESRKFNSKLFFFDQKKASKVFINAIGGKYYNIMNTPNNRNRLYLNPLQLQDTTKNKIFIVSWLGDLITSAGGILNKKDYDIIEKAVHEVYDLGEPERRIAQICKALGKLDRIDLAVHLQIWYGNGELAHVFDNEEDGIINAPGLIHGFNMDSVTHDSRLLAPVLAYYFHIIELSLDGSPVMIVLDEAWKLIDNDLFASHIREWLDYLREKNAMVIFATESLDDIANSKITYSLIEKVATQIYLPNSNVDDNNHGAYQDVFRLNDKELSLLMSMEVEERQFLLKHGNEAVIAKLDLKSMKELLVLSGGEHTEQVMNELIGSVGSEPDHWLPQFYKELS